MKEIIESRQLRDKMAGRYEVLEKVKKLLLIPEMESMTLKQVSDYYEVKENAIRVLMQRNSDELESDGMRKEKMENFLKAQDVLSERTSYKAILRYGNGIEFTVTNGGLKIFPRRAILRVGMLLRDSEIAKEVRTQLLNIEEKTSDEVKTTDLNEEMKLALSLGMAQASGNVEAYQKAVTDMMAFKNRHITKLESDNGKLVNDNKALAGNILDWGDRKSLNAGIRQLAAVTGVPFGKMWSGLYKELQYKYGICLSQRNNGKKPWIGNVKEKEWNDILKTFCAMCEAYEQSPSEMFQKLTPKLV